MQTIITGKLGQCGQGFVCVQPSAVWCYVRSNGLLGSIPETALIKPI